MKNSRYIYCVFLLILISCNTKTGDFSVKPPQGWVSIDTLTEVGSKKIKMHPVEKNFIESINIAVFTNQNLDEYMSGVVSKFRERAASFKIEGKGSLSTNQYQGKWIQCSTVLKGYSIQFEQKVYFLGSGGNVFMIVCTTGSDGMSNLQRKIDEVLNTFTIL